jgi:hypothetical protein
VMRELEGLSHEEIAAALGVSGGAARQAIFRARSALREGLGLLLPMPVLRALAEHGGEVAGAGVAAGALKVGLATVLVAGTVGAGVAIEHRQGERAGPEAAGAAPLPRDDQQRTTSRSTVAGPPDITSDRHRGEGPDHGGNRGEGQDDGPSSLDNGNRSGSDDGSHHSKGKSGPSAEDDSGHSGPGSGSGSIDNSGPGSGRGGDDDSVEDHSGPGSGSDDGRDDYSGSSGDDGGSSSGPGSGDDGSSSGPGSGGDSVTEIAPAEPEIEEDNSGSDSESSASDDDSVIFGAPSG